MVVSSLLTEAGFESAEKASVETLTEMLQSCECGAFGAGLGPPPSPPPAPRGPGIREMRTWWSDLQLYTLPPLDMG